jgi:hypothetical protein
MLADAATSVVIGATARPVIRINRVDCSAGACHQVVHMPDADVRSDDTPTRAGELRDDDGLGLGDSGVEVWTCSP